MHLYFFPSVLELKSLNLIGHWAYTCTVVAGEWMSSEHQMKGNTVSVFTNDSSAHKMCVCGQIENIYVITLVLAI